MIGFLKKPLLQRHERKDHIVCGFCGGSNAAFIYASKRTRDGKETPCWRWAVCAGCSQAVDTEDWEVIYQRFAPRVSKLIEQHIGAPLPAYELADVVVRAIKIFYQDAINNAD